MALLIVGLILFLGAHTFSTFRAARDKWIATLGASPYRGLHALVSLTGFALIIWGFSRYRADGLIMVWFPPHWTSHVSILIMAFAWISLVTANPAPSRLRGWIQHPQLVAVMLWSIAHLIANGDLGGIVLFASFGLWAIYDRVQVERRGAPKPPRLDHFTLADALQAVGGLVLWAAMIVLHPYILGPTVLAF